MKNTEIWWVHVFFRNKKKRLNAKSFELVVLLHQCRKMNNVLVIFYTQKISNKKKERLCFKIRNTMGKKIKDYKPN